nr:FadR/GntR family transcriptional regulator [Dactylosporangium thailandense]
MDIRSTQVADLGTRVRPARERLADTVAGALTEDIATGVIPPGVRLPNEQELANHFGVGKSVIREAMKVVAIRGLVTVQQGTGTVVNPRGQWNLHDPGVVRAMRYHLHPGQLVEVRRLLEPEMARLAASRAEEGDLARLRDILDRQAEMQTKHEVALWSLEFHEAIAEATHNPIYGILTSALRALMVMKLADGSARPDSSMKPEWTVDTDHRKIYEAIESRDPQRAHDYALAHLDQLGPHWEWLSSESGWDATPAAD